MNTIREQAVRMIYDLSDDNLNFLMEIIRRLMQNEPEKENAFQDQKNEESMQAFYGLEEARIEIWKYLPEDFDPEQELLEALNEKYGIID